MPKVCNTRNGPLHLRIRTNTLPEYSKKLDQKVNDDLQIVD